MKLGSDWEIVKYLTVRFRYDEVSRGVLLQRLETVFGDNVCSSSIKRSRR